MIYAFYALVIATLLTAIYDWRRGILLCLAVGFLQDPARKLAPGRPVAFVVVVAVCFVACLASVYLRGRRLGVRPLFGLHPELSAPSQLFFAIVVVQAIQTVVRTGNPVLAGIGLLSYLTPPLAMVLGFHFESCYGGLRRWLAVYLVGVTVLGASVGLAYAGYQSRIFDSIGIDIVYGASGAVKMMSGIARSSEIAAWHLAAGVCLLVSLLLTVRALGRRFAGSLLVAGLLIALLLTGRRKMLGAVVLFVLLFVLLAARRKRVLTRLVRIGLALALLGVVGLQLFSRSAAAAESYLARGFSVFADATGRLEHMTIHQFEWVLRRNGFFGSGAGTGAQGSQYFGGGAQIVGAAAEGGLGKILAELGVPGLLALVWLGVACGKVFLRRARQARALPEEEAILRFALIAFLPANAAVFLTAHQVFGDPFVLILLGWMAGSALAVRLRAVPPAPSPYARETGRRFVGSAPVAAPR